MTQIQLRRATAASWTSVNPILALGEVGIETDTYKLKVGNGTSQWSALPYFVTAWADITGKPAVLASGATQADARTAIGLGNVENTSDSTKNSAAVTLTNKTLTNPTINAYTEGVVDLGILGSAQTLSIASGTVITATLGSNLPCTFTMPTASAGKSFVLMLRQAGASVGNASAYFNGSSRLTVANNTVLNMGTGDFTWELWFNADNTSGYKGLITKGDGAGGGSTIGLWINANTVYFNGGSGNSIQGGSTFTAGSWNHIAVTRSGSSIRLWLNGVQQGSTMTDSPLTDFTTSASLAIGDRTAGHPNGQYPFFGSISNVRIVKGTSLYNANFTPPNAPLSAVSGTSLLTCRSSTSITDESVNALTITSTGATASASAPFSSTPATATFSGVKWPGATAPTITATAGKMDIFSFVSDGAAWFGTAAQNFTP